MVERLRPDRRSASLSGCRYRCWLLCRPHGVVPLVARQGTASSWSPTLTPAGNGRGPAPSGPQAGMRRGRPDQLQDHLVAGSGRPRQVHRDHAEQPVLDPVPLGGTRRQVAGGDRKPGFSRQPSQLDLPRPHPVAVGPTGIRTDQQPLGLRVGDSADLLPPASERLDRERRDVVVCPDTDPAAVATRVVDPIAQRSSCRSVRCGAPSEKVAASTSSRSTCGPNFNR
jgi:hypothetical protein